MQKGDLQDRTHTRPLEAAHVHPKACVDNTPLKRRREDMSAVDRTKEDPGSSQDSGKEQNVMGENNGIAGN